ncbi:SDR family NAD(P)-dependent oxidoreductase [Agreia sp.]|uniref:SDR family NAD(P)-dependent oxidoreductase n=1 Tax=Agreia sp. TaxID=1872416 RepID=UPI0035BC2380
MHYRGTTALITGASSGIGAEFARAFANRGADVVLVARATDALDAIATNIRTRTGVTVHVVSVDLSLDHSGRRLRESVDALGVQVDTLVNCAGAGLTKPFAESTEEEILRQLRLNVDAVVDISRAFLPSLIQSGRGALINVGSLTGYMPVPGMAVYAAAKAFTVRFTEAIAHELRQTKLTVMAISPGPTRTGFYSTSGTDVGGVRFQTPEQVVDTALRAVDRRKPPVSVISGGMNRWTSRIVALLPRRVALRLTESKPAATD